MKENIINKIDALLGKCDLTTLEAVYNALDKMINKEQARTVFGFIARLF